MYSDGKQTNWGQRENGEGMERSRVVVTEQSRGCEVPSGECRQECSDDCVQGRVGLECWASPGKHFVKYVIDCLTTLLCTWNYTKYYWMQTVIGKGKQHLISVIWSERKILFSWSVLHTPKLWLVWLIRRPPTLLMLLLDLGQSRTLYSKRTRGYVWSQAWPQVTRGWFAQDGHPVLTPSVAHPSELPLPLCLLVCGRKCQLLLEHKISPALPWPHSVLKGGQRSG